MINSALRMLILTFIAGLFLLADAHFTRMYVETCEQRTLADAYWSRAHMTWSRYIDVAFMRGPWPNRRCR